MINFEGLTDKDVAKLAKDFYADTLSIFSELRSRGCTILLGDAEVGEPSESQRTIKIVRSQEL